MPVKIRGSYLAKGRNLSACGRLFVIVRRVGPYLSDLTSSSPGENSQRFCSPTISLPGAGDGRTGCRAMRRQMPVDDELSLLVATGPTTDGIFVESADRHFLEQELAIDIIVPNEVIVRAGFCRFHRTFHGRCLGQGLCNPINTGCLIAIR